VIDRIDRLGHLGDGIARALASGPIFVRPASLPGEVVDGTF
jgi:tRNA/tmRNA/rRNA uracil-C5-methylase (TrmA/RlmC/RlmD family)